MLFFRRKKKTNTVFLGIVVLLGAGTSLFIYKETAKPLIAEFQPVAVTLPSRMARLTLNFGNGTSREFRGEIVPSMSALDALTYAASAGNIPVEYVNGNEGMIVRRVGEKQTGVLNKQWRLYVNGHYAQGDPATYTVNPMDGIEWRYE